MRKDSIARVEQWKKDSIARVQQARKDSLDRVEKAKAYADSIAAVEKAHKAYLDSLTRAEQARLDDLTKAKEDSLKRVEQARIDSLNKVQQAWKESMAAQQAKQDSIRKAVADSIAAIRQAEQDRIVAAQLAAQARIDSINAAQQAERERLDSIAAQQEAERLSIDSLRQMAQSEAVVADSERSGAPRRQAPVQSNETNDTRNQFDSIMQRMDNMQTQINNIARSNTQTTNPGVIVIMPNGSTTYPANTTDNSVNTAYSNEAATNDQTVAQPDQMSPIETVDQEAPVVENESGYKRILHSYYRHSGSSSLSIISAGYSTYFLLPSSGMEATHDFGKRHILNFEIFEWRAKMFGMSLFNFEMGINTPRETPGDVLTMFQRGGTSEDKAVSADAKTMWFAYKPTAKIYIPIAKWCAIQLYGGVEVDVTKLWDKISTNYYASDHAIPQQNYFVSGFGGAGFMFTAVPALPLEIKAEYRHPVKGNTALVPQGIYLSAQIHLTAPIRKDKQKQ